MCVRVSFYAENQGLKKKIRLEIAVSFLRFTRQICSIFMKRLFPSPRHSLTKRVRNFFYFIFLKYIYKSHLSDPLTQASAVVFCLWSGAETRFETKLCLNTTFSSVGDLQVHSVFPVDDEL